MIPLSSLLSSFSVTLIFFCDSLAISPDLAATE